MIRVVVIDEEGVETVEELATPKVSLGRVPNNDIVLPAGIISKRHAVIEYEPSDGSFVVTDNGSANGVRINGERISGSSPVTPHDEITVGPYTLKVSATKSTTGRPAKQRSATEDDWDDFGADTVGDGSENDTVPIKADDGFDDFDDFDEPATAGADDGFDDFDDDAPAPVASPADDDGFDDFDDEAPAAEDEDDGFDDFDDTPAAADEGFDDFEDEAPAAADDGFDDFDDGGEAVSASQRAATQPSDGAAPTKRRTADRAPRLPPAPDTAEINIFSEDESGRLSPVRLLERYIELDEQRRLALIGKSCRCGECLLCEARSAVRRAKSARVTS